MELDRIVKQAIQTKYRGPTNFRGARIIASCDALRISVPWDYALEPAANHRAAAEQLVQKLGWKVELIGGSFKDRYVFVLV